MKNYQNWNWEKEDPVFYKNFHRLPESEDKNYREQIKRRRFEIVANKFKMDLRPRVFMRVMSKELLLLSFGIFFGLSLPFYYKYVNRISRRPTEHEVERMREDFAKKSDIFRLPQSRTPDASRTTSFVVNQSVYGGAQGGQKPDALDQDTIEFMQEFNQAQDEAGRRNQRKGYIQIGRGYRTDERKPPPRGGFL